jgi:hypothetical protein
MAPNPELKKMVEQVQAKFHREPEVMDEITGRDDYIIGKALLYAVAAIQALPEDKRELGDMSDMCKLIRACSGAQLWYHVANVEAHIDREIDLWPDADLLTEQDRAEMAQMRDRINRFRADFNSRTL